MHLRHPGTRQSKPASGPCLFVRVGDWHRVSFRQCGPDQRRRSPSRLCLCTHGCGIESRTNIRDLFAFPQSRNHRRSSSLCPGGRFCTPLFGQCAEFSKNKVTSKESTENALDALLHGLFQVWMKDGGNPYCLGAWVSCQIELVKRLGEAGSFDMSYEEFCAQQSCQPEPSRTDAMVRLEEFKM